MMKLDRCMGNNVLLVAPTINDLYKDIISQLKDWGMEVDFIEDRAERFDPNYIRNEWHNFYDNSFWRERFQQKLDIKWKELLSTQPFDKNYDYLLVIDGQSVSPFLFKELKSRNHNLWAANYLFDSTTSLYRFQVNFNHFNLVASFDLRDCEKYGLLFLPIYWCEQQMPQAKEYDLFGFGTYSSSRYALFNKVNNVAKELKLKSYIKLYCMEISNFRRYNCKRILRKMLGLKTYISSEHYNSSLITHKLLPSAEFRRLIYASEIIIDSVNFDQDGMTARFMWALGAGKKIITTNTNYHKYKCYNPEQVYIVDNLSSINCPTFLKFLQSHNTITDKQKEILAPWRIDRWIATLLNLQ